MPVLFFVVTAGLYVPSSIFLGNINEFVVDYVQILPCMLLPSLAALALGLAVGWALRRRQRAAWFWIDLLFGVTLAVYVQCNFLNGGLKILNGTEVDWQDTSLPALLSAAAWTVCVALPHALRRIVPKVESLVSRYGSALLTAMQVVSLAAMLLTTTRTMSNDIIITKQNEFLLSGKENEIVFVVDTLDTEWAEQYIIKDPAYDDYLRDFTYFDNVVGGGAPTVLGMPTLLTGKLYDPEETLEAYYKSAYADSTLFSDLGAGGASVRIYTKARYLEGANPDEIGNAVTDLDYEIKKPARFTRNLYKLTAFLGAPYQLKKHFLLFSSALTSNVKLVGTDMKNVTLNDPKFYKDLKKKGITLSDEDRLFVLYHFFGAHGPYTMDENAKKVPSDQTSLKQQILGTFKIIFEYIDEMKALGVYDDSTIIITADHGGVALYQNPAVFIKRRGERREEMATNSAPLTFNNLRATFVQTLDGAGAESYGPGMYDVAEDAEVEPRPLVAASILRKNVYKDKKILYTDYLEFQIGNPARDNSLVRESDAKVANRYALGEKVHLCGKKASPVFAMSGFSIIENKYRWTNGDESRIPLRIVEPFENLELTLDYEAFSGHRGVKLYANDQLVLEGNLLLGPLDGIVIPGSCVEEDGFLELRFELLDAVSPKELGLNNDKRRVSISLRSFSLASTSEPFRGPLQIDQ